MQTEKPAHWWTSTPRGSPPVAELISNCALSSLMKPRLFRPGSCDGASTDSGLARENRSIGGSYFRQPQNLHRLTVGLIDLDTPGANANGEVDVDASRLSTRGRTDIELCIVESDEAKVVSTRQL
jgi:hypothetical protein